jgi:hypothetical protein
MGSVTRSQLAGEPLGAAAHRHGSDAQPARDSDILMALGHETHDLELFGRWLFVQHRAP